MYLPPSSLSQCPPPNLVVWPHFPTRTSVASLSPSYELCFATKEKSGPSQLSSGAMILPQVTPVITCPSSLMCFPGCIVYIASRCLSSHNLLLSSGSTGQELRQGILVTLRSAPGTCTQLKASVTLAPPSTPKPAARKCSAHCHLSCTCGLHSTAG